MSEALRARTKNESPQTSASDDAGIPLLTERLAEGTPTRPPPTLPPLELDITLPHRFDQPIFDLNISASSPTESEIPIANIPQSSPSSSPSSPPPQPPALPASPSPQSASTATGQHWTRIEIELRESVLKTLSEQLPQNVDDIVRRHMSATAEVALREMLGTLSTRFALEAKLALASSLREIVEHAVKAELERLRAMRSK